MNKANRKKKKKTVSDFIIRIFLSEKSLDLEYTILNLAKYIFAANFDYKEIINDSPNINVLIKFLSLYKTFHLTLGITLILFKKIGLKYKTNIEISSLLIYFVKNGY